MHLFELTSLDLHPSGPSVPGWTLGCFRRRSITFFTGAEDTTTEVLWLQSRGLTADFRRPRRAPPLEPAPLEPAPLEPAPLEPAGLKPPSLARPRATRRAPPLALSDLPLEELLALASVEAGMAHTRYDGELMRWSSWTSFQTHPRWPEPGQLRRVGGCLIEFAPSGAYVEDWRLQPSGGGPLIGLSLLEERDVRSGALRHRGGGLIVCGRHAAFVRGRPGPEPEGARLADFVRTHAGDARALERAFAFDAAYGQSTAPGDGFTVTLATLPWREGEPLLSLEGFSVDRERGLCVQRVEEGGVALERRFSVDTLERELDGRLATEASRAAELWLEQEQDLLLATVR